MLKGAKAPTDLEHSLQNDLSKNLRFSNLSFRLKLQTGNPVASAQLLCQDFIITNEEKIKPTPAFKELIQDPRRMSQYIAHYTIVVSIFFSHYPNIHVLLSWVNCLRPEMPCLGYTGVILG